jgi:ribonucleotide monophosphatase NagD (HAD superfamily)
MNIQNNILSVADQYDVFFLDMFGVLYDGQSLFDGVLPTMEKLQAMGKKLVILSNATQIADDAKVSYEKRGLRQHVHYDEFITSGEFVRDVFSHHMHAIAQFVGAKVRTICELFSTGARLFDGSSLEKVWNPEDADLLYVGIIKSADGDNIRIDNLIDWRGDPVSIQEVLHSDWKSLRDESGRFVLAEIATCLESCLGKGKTLMVANPDIFAHAAIATTRQICPIITQGGVGRYYERMGGRVIYFGKPYAGIFAYAKAKCLAEVQRCAMVGDTVWTDVLGGNVSGMDSILVLKGVTEEFLDRMPSSLSMERKISILLREIAPKMIDNCDTLSLVRNCIFLDEIPPKDCGDSFVAEALDPHHIIEQFA